MISNVVFRLTMFYRKALKIELSSFTEFKQRKG